MALSIESINEQFITQGSTYDLVVDITGDPDTVKVFGAVEGFYQDWDAANDELHIKSSDASRLINGQEWRIEAVKSSETVTAKIVWNVIKAAAILQTLPTLHLYKGVPLNFDIIIYNIPPIVRAESLLVGVKSELLEYGLNFKGTLPADADLTVTTENIKLTLPATPGHAETTKKYPFRIETGTPPQIASPQFRPYGNFGKLAFTDVSNALAYQWRLDNAEDWNTFDSTRAVIDPGEIEVTLGNLEATIKFPNISGASSYEYRLDTEDSEGSWVRFTGTLANGFITTIISNLEEGVAYSLRLRVGAPWVGTPITIPIRGGRICYTLQINTGDRDNQWLYIFSTGHSYATQASRVKRFLLPTAMSHLRNGGIAVNSDGDVFVIQSENGAAGEKAVYVFLSNTIDSAVDGSRLTQDRKHPFPSAAILGNQLPFLGMAEYGGKLYTLASAASTGWRGLQVWNIPTVDGTELTRTTTGDNLLSNVGGTGLSVTKERVWYKRRIGSNDFPAPVDRDDFSVLGSHVVLRNLTNTANDEIEDGFKVIGNNFYNIVESADRLELFRINPDVSPTAHILDFYLTLPIGLNSARFIDILV